MKIKQAFLDFWRRIKPVMPRIKTWFSVIVTGLIVFFVGKYINKNWAQLSSQEWHIQWGWLGISLIFYVTFWFQRAITWMLFIRWNGGTGNFARGVLMWFQSSLARYLPLPIFEAGGRIYSATQLGTDGKTAFWVYLAEVFASVVMAAIVSLFALPVLTQNSISLARVLFLIVFLSLVMAALTFLIFPLLKKFKISLKIRFHQAILWYSLYLFGFLMQGLSYYFIMKSIQFDAASVTLIIGASNFAWMAGLLNVFSPSGIGTRELVLFYTLQNQFATQAVIYLGVAARLLGTFAEIGINLIGYLITLIGKRRIPKEKIEADASISK